MLTPVKVVPFSMDYVYEVRDHLIKQFGGCESCCDVFAPKVGTTFVVTEPIQGCHHQNKPLLPGTYTVTKWVTDNLSHHIRFRKDGDDEDLGICVGYSGSNQLDWRGVKAQ